MTVEGVLFDVDGTILNTERLYMEAWRKAAIRQGFRMDEEYLLKTRAMDKNTAMKLFDEYYGSDYDYMTTWKLRVEIAEDVIDNLEEPSRLYKPGVPEIFDWLDAHGIRKAAASGTGYAIGHKHLVATKISDRFPVQINGDMVERGKPFPDIFLRAAQEIGVSPEKCIVCEDSRAGIEAAAAAGMMPVFIEDCVPINDRVRELACAVLPTLKELPALIEKINRAQR